MSCNHCNNKFNFFHKEMGCSNCGLSFCSKCLKQKWKFENKSQDLPVCKTCYMNLSQNIKKVVNIPPPDTYLKRLEALENPVAPPITMYKHDPKLDHLRKNLSAADQQILDRLEKLKHDKNEAPPPDDELRKRLNNLKGTNNYIEGPSKFVSTTDNRSDQEKVDSLLEMFVTERDIELAHNPEEGIEARLATLRGQGARPNESAYISNLHDSDSEEEVDALTKKIMDEVALDEKCTDFAFKHEIPSKSQLLEKEGKRDNSSPELPWCVLCNKDAKYRCLDCEDLYCSECNVEVHKTWGDTDHRVVDYKP